VTGPAVDSAACPVDGPVDGPAGGPAPARRRGEPLLESRAYLELARLLADPVWRGHGVPVGDGRTVLLLPGYLAGDNTLSLLARFLRRIGHRPAFAGIAFNSGCARSYAGRMADALRHQRAQTGREVAIVGHSRGGHYAKALATEHPQDVSHVVCLGSGLESPLDTFPVTRLTVATSRRLLAPSGSPRGELGCLTGECNCELARAYRRPYPGRPRLTSIYTRSDGMVRWQSCAADYATCVEVPGSHVGLTFNRHAYRAVAEALATPPAPADLGHR